MANPSFTQNYRDLSNDSGFQFEFFCDRCRSGHRSEFRTNKLGIATSILKAVSALLGGATARAGYGADHLRDAFRGSGRDKALHLAIVECKPRLNQCPACTKWVCSTACWNSARGECWGCASAAA